MSERTEIYVAYDETFLYFGVRAYDSEPDRIVARQFERDSDLDADDSISIGIDSRNDNRTSFAFQTNVLGTQRDLELTEAGAFNMPWDTIWYSAGNVDELGYTIEMAIPFFALRFQPGEEVEMGIILGAHHPAEEREGELAQPVARLQLRQREASGRTWRGYAGSSAVWPSS